MPKTIPFVLLILLAGCAPPRASDNPEDESAAALSDAPGTQTVFLNFGGARVHHGNCSDAPSNCSSLVSGTQDLQPFTLSDEFDRGKTVAALTQCVREFYTDMNVRFVTDRPTRDDYTMIVIGAIYPTQLGFAEGGGPFGRAPLDCNNSNRNDIGFILLQDDIRPDLYYTCRSIAHELGHSFGMLHTQGAAAYSSGRVDAMCDTDECHQRAANGEPWDFVNAKMETESRACDYTYEQNTYGALLESLGVVR